MPRNTVRRLAGTGLALALAVSAISIRAQQQPPQQQPPQQERPQVQSIQGVVQEVDTEAKALTIAPAEGQAQRILYSDETKVSGAQGGVAGLAGTDGREVRVQFMVEGARRMATSIEVLPEK